MINHAEISALLQEEEEECLNYMIKVEVEEYDDIKSGYRIQFHFAPNPFFENNMLAKEFFLGGPSGPMSKSTVIEWKEGKDLQKSQLKRKQLAPGRKRHLDSRTFFDWFSDNSDPINDEIAELLKGIMLASHFIAFYNRFYQLNNLLLHFYQ